MTDRKGVLVRFPPDVLADLDAEAKRTGKSRNDIIVERCERPAAEQPSRQVAKASTPSKSVAARTFGPQPTVPGSRLKKR